MKLKRLIKLSLIILTSIIVLLTTTFVIIMETSGDDYLTEESKMEMISSIQKSETLPDNFFQAYTNLYPRSLSGNYWGYAFERLIFKNSDRQCPCSRVPLFFPIEKINYSRGFYKLAPAMIGLELEDFVTQKQCLNYICNNSHFIYGVIGISNSAKNFYIKELQDLNEFELAGLLAIMENPTYYNRKQHPDNFDKKRNEIFELIRTN